MRSLTELPRDELKVALDANEVMVRFKAYLPSGSPLYLLVLKFRNNVRAALQMERGELPERGNARWPLDALTSLEFDRVRGAVTILLQERFTACMADPTLPRLLCEYMEALNEQRAEREHLRAETRVL
jgi:hypothetical protein